MSRIPDEEGDSDEESDGSIGRVVRGAAAVGGPCGTGGALLAEGRTGLL